MTQDGKETKTGTISSSVFLWNGIIYVICLIILMIKNLTPCILFPYRVVPQSIAFFLLVQLVFTRLGNMNLLKLVFVFLKIDPLKIDPEEISKTLYIPIKTVYILALFFIFIALSGYIIVVPVSALRISETPPVVNGFEVTYIDTGITTLIQPGTEVDTEDGISVKARIDGGNENTCSWFAAKGSIYPGKCQVQYTPTTGGIDVITLTVRSTCETMETSATLCINTACLKPKP